MKKKSRIFLIAGLCALSLVLGTGCGDDQSSSAPDTSIGYAADISRVESTADSSAAELSSSDISNTESSESSDESSSDSAADDLWKSAQYKEDTEIGEGKTTVKVEVKAGDKAITVTVHTDADNLGKALTDNKLVSGEDGEYGLYIKVVNGIKADYDTDKAYWAISKDGEMTPTGADSTKIADGEHYELTYTKG